MSEAGGIPPSFLSKQPLEKHQIQVIHTNNCFINDNHFLIALQLTSLSLCYVHSCVAFFLTLAAPLYTIKLKPAPEVFMHNLPLVIDCVLLSLAAGLVYGLFGSGSGLVMAPGFYYVLGHFHLTQDHRMQIAIATTAAASAVMGFFSSRVQRKSNNVDYEIVKKVAPGLAVGTLLAVLLLNVFSSDFLKHLFGVVVITVSIWMWFYDQKNDPKQWSLDHISNKIKTFFIGLLWFLLGIAVFTVPYLHKSGVSMRRSIGCASTIGAIFSAFATVLLVITGYFTVHASVTHVGYVNLVLLLISLIPSALAAYIGSKISHIPPQKIMKKYYAGLICLVGFLMLI